MESKPKTEKTEAEWQKLAERDAAMWRRVYEFDAEMTSQAIQEAADRYQAKLRQQQPN